jgi:hypothetical protein
MSEKDGMISEDQHDYEVDPATLSHTQVLIHEPDARTQSFISRWVLKREGSDQDHHGKKSSWWAVMCLTGVDYFSTLGYQPAIAALAAGLLSPMATLVLVLLTLFGALPVYRRVANASFKGEGSIALLERLLPWWAGKLFVLVMLGFAATDFMITITLSAADAAAHAVSNPIVANSHLSQMALTLVLIAVLGLVFLIGFKEAIGLAVGLVGVYLALNLVVVIVGFAHVLSHPVLVANWNSALYAQHGNPIVMVAIALMVFPKLALGLSGFETGVAVMPQIKGSVEDGRGRPLKRIAGAKKLLTTAAVIMSFFLITTSFITTLLIPQAEFQPGGQANGRALAYLAHLYLGPVFGTAYDISTILILWFAGASAMAGLLNLVPRYLPRYGMAPQWAAYSRPLVFVFIGVAIYVTWIFQANVDAQAGAYATGVLVLITSASLSATLLARSKKQIKLVFFFSLITALFAYTTVANVIERPDGVRIASFFIAGIIAISISSRVQRAFQLRSRTVHFDDDAHKFLTLDAVQEHGVILIAHEPHGEGQKEYDAKEKDERRWGNIPQDKPTLFLEVAVSDSSDFIEDLNVDGGFIYGHRSLRVKSNSIPNAIAAVLLAIRDEYGVVPDIYFEWSEGNPISNMAKFLITGGGEIAVVTREVLRQAEPNHKVRPRVHVS